MDDGTLKSIISLSIYCFLQFPAHCIVLTSVSVFDLTMSTSLPIAAVKACADRNHLRDSCK